MFNLAESTVFEMRAAKEGGHKGNALSKHGTMLYHYAAHGRHWAQHLGWPFVKHQES